MANAVHTSTSLELKCITGVKPDGKDQVNTIAFTNVKVEATVDNIANAGLAIEKLLKAEIISFGKRDFSIIETNPVV